MKNLIQKITSLPTIVQNFLEQSEEALFYTILENLLKSYNLSDILRHLSHLMPSDHDSQHCAYELNDLADKLEKYQPNKWDFKNEILWIGRRS